jgi:putative ABC transport system permease protein
MLPPGSLASIRIGLASLAANPLRTALSTLGIVMGSASLIAVLALGDGLERFARVQIESTTDLHALSLTPQVSRQVDGQRLMRSDIVRFDPDIADSLLAGLPEAASAVLTLSGGAELASGRPGAPRAALVTAVWYRGSSLPARLGGGRAFTAEESRGTADLALISDTLARSIAGGGTPEGAIGATIAVNGNAFRIIGVLKRRALGERFEVVVPFGAAARALPPAPGSRVPTLVVAARDLEDAPRLRRALEGRLATRYPDWQERVQLASNATRLDQARRGMLVFKLVMGAITGISLLVGGVGIMNVLLAAVVERTREIGIRKAVGARRRDILTQFLSESVAISGAGSVLGMLIGVGGAFGITAVIRSRSEAQVYAGLAWSSIAVAVLAALTVGLVFGCYPALRAARLSPIDAIRHE